LLIVLGDIADKRFRPLRHVTVTWSVGLSVTSCIVLKRQKISTRFFTCVQQLLVSPRSCQNLAYIGQPLPPQKFGPNRPIPRWLQCRRHSTANCGWIGNLEIAQWSQWRAYRKPPTLFQIVQSQPHSTTPSDVAFPQITLALILFPATC